MKKIRRVQTALKRFELFIFILRTWIYYKSFRECDFSGSQQ